jgi:hypothetical protein
MTGTIFQMRCTCLQTIQLYTHQLTTIRLLDVPRERHGSEGRGQVKARDRETERERSFIDNQEVTEGR